MMGKMTKQKIQYMREKPVFEDNEPLEEDSPRGIEDINEDDFENGEFNRQQKNIVKRQKTTDSSENNIKNPFKNLQ